MPLAPWDAVVCHAWLMLGSRQPAWQGLEPPAPLAPLCAPFRAPRSPAPSDLPRWSRASPPAPRPWRRRPSPTWARCKGRWPPSTPCRPACRSGCSPSPSGGLRPSPAWPAAVPTAGAWRPWPCACLETRLQCWPATIGWTSFASCPFGPSSRCCRRTGCARRARTTCWWVRPLQATGRPGAGEGHGMVMQETVKRGKQDWAVAFIHGSCASCNLP
jgi:hypothetical protein